jgi:hypothetical protein
VALRRRGEGVLGAENADAVVDQTLGE